ncbi:MAG: glycine cleavage system aminomethyltransferase GcvT, partial [Burkholderiales bacterium]
MLKQTPLNAAHRAGKAKLVDFGGWEMPLHYGSQIEEHHRVRRDAGMFDVSHMLAIDLEGSSARDLLRRLLANNVDRLGSPGKALYSCMLNEDAGVLDDLIVYLRDENRFRMIVNAATAEKDLDWIARQRKQTAPALKVMPRRDLALIAVQGPNARAKVWQVAPDVRSYTQTLGAFAGAESNGWLVARTGYTGEDGFEIMLPAAQARPLWDALLAAG